MFPGNPSAGWFHTATGYAVAGPLAATDGPIPSDAPSLPDPALPPSLSKMLDLRVSCRRFSPEPFWWKQSPGPICPS